MRNDKSRPRYWPGMIALFLAGLMVLAGCRGTAEDPAATGGAATTPALTFEALRNGRYGGIYDEMVQLTNGEYEGEPFEEGGASRPTVTLLDVHALGDLNGDGVDDAAVALVESSGGSGNFRYLAVVLNEGGSPENVATLLIGDREQVRSMEIDGSTITVGAVTHGPDDPQCCPTQQATLIYELDGEQLTKVAEEVLQEPPADGDAVSLTGTPWMLISLVNRQGEAVQVLTGSTITAEFSDDWVAGNTGCNDYSASYEFGGGAISVDPVGATRMACAEPDGVMEQELDYLSALRAAAGYQVTGDTLMLTDVDGITLATFASVLQAMVLDVTWQWTELVAAEPSVELLVPDPERSTLVSDPERYTLMLSSDGSYRVEADCNAGSGGYTLVGSNLMLAPGPMTLAECGPESLYVLYLESLGSVESAGVDGGSLVLRLGSNAGLMVFRNAGSTGGAGG